VLPHRTSLRTELELRRLVSEIAQIRDQIDGKPKADAAAILSNPTWLAVLGVIASVATGFWQLHANRQLEREKLRSTLIQEASKSGSPETTLKNLKFLVKAGLVEDEKGAIAALKLGEVPSFQLLPAVPLTRAEMTESFGDPKLVPKKGDDGLMGFAEPDETWLKANLIEVDLPNLIGVPGFPQSGKIKFHRKAAPHLQAAIAEISRKGLIGKIRSFDGAWVPRTIRGSGGTYSAHAFGIALDINSKWNSLGKPPLLPDQDGSTVELVPIFESHGFYWGGRFRMPEGGHFQYGIKSSTVQVAASAPGG
jgi:D-alanyl-D-alanine carboxypeptidase